MARQVFTQRAADYPHAVVPSAGVRPWSATVSVAVQLFHEGAGRAAHDGGRPAANVGRGAGVSDGPETGAGLPDGQNHERIGLPTPRATTASAVKALAAPDHEREVRTLPGASVGAPAVMSTIVPLVEREAGGFTLRYIVEPERGCHIWIGSRDAKGYGLVGTSTNTRRAHRVAYEEVHGPVPDGLVLDHECRTRACVNARHLRAVTNAQNCRTGGKAKLDMGRAREIRAAREAGEPAASLARRYGVGETTIEDVVAGRTWRE